MARETLGFSAFDEKEKNISLTYAADRLSAFVGNKAGYTATPVACGWAGAIIEVTNHLGRSSEAKNCKNPKKVKCAGPTDGRTDERTDGRTDKAGCRVA